MGSRTPSSVPGVLLKIPDLSPEISRKTISLPRITGKEVVASLLRRELANRRENTESIASEHDDVGRLLGDVARNPGVGDVLDRVRASGVLRDTDVVVVGYAVNRVVNHILEDRAEADGSVDLGLLLRREVDALGVASTFDVENAIVGPNVLIVTNEFSMGVSGKGPVWNNMSEAVSLQA